MRLLICTQAIDANDPYVGFFVHWVEELAAKVEHIDIICLKEGEHTLPQNVRVHSLGKERGSVGRLAYAKRFRAYLRSLAGQYDRVLVHMNPEYVLLGGLYWRRRHIPIALWYNHPHKGLRLTIAMRLATRIFYTSSYAATAHSPKAIQMPVGIDTERFKPVASHARHAIYMQGRVMPSKRIEIALAALRLVRQELPATLTIVGPEDTAYAAELRARFADLVEARAVVFKGPKKNDETPVLYSAHGVAINLAASGHFDKTAFEAMACETPVIVSSAAFVGILTPEWIVPEESASALAEALLRVMHMPEEEYAVLGARERAEVVRDHSLAALVEKLVAALYSPESP